MATTPRISTGAKSGGTDASADHIMQVHDLLESWDLLTREMQKEILVLRAQRDENRDAVKLLVDRLAECNVRIRELIYEHSRATSALELRTKLLVKHNIDPQVDPTRIRKET